MLLNFKAQLVGLKPQLLSAGLAIAFSLSLSQPALSSDSSDKDTCAPDSHAKPTSTSLPPGQEGRPPMGRRWGGGFGAGPLDLAPLNLTPEQKQRIQEIRKKAGAKARDLHKNLKDKRTEMRDSMFDPQVTEAQLRTKHRQVRKLQEQAEDTMFENFLAIRALLTPEQKKHLPEVKPPFREPPPPFHEPPPKEETMRPGPPESGNLEAKVRN